MEFRRVLFRSANQTEDPKSLSQFDVMVDYWLKYYFTNASYLRKNGEPVVFVFSPSRLNKNASGFGETGASLLKRARDKARQAGQIGRASCRERVCQYV